jgi:hypothetical protein
MSIRMTHDKASGNRRRASWRLHSRRRTSLRYCSNADTRLRNKQREALRRHTTQPR